MFYICPHGGGLKWNLALEERLKDEKCLERYGYKVYSQNDEDGILHEIFQRIGIEYHNFVEFGVGKGVESNCHSLLLQGWHGIWIEGRTQAYKQILRRFAPAIRKGQLKVLNRYVTRDNINEILTKESCYRGLDLLSIDVDGNDWHIWNAVEDAKPRVVVIEYNGKFPPEIDWKMAYNENHVWDRSDRQGASLTALEKLGRNKGYQLVGTNLCGINAFFVRKDCAEGKFIEPATAEKLYNPARLNILYHYNGHPGLNYVGNDIEGMEGVFQYYPDWNALPSFGYYRTEFRGEHHSFLMQEKKSRLFVRFIPQNARMIRLHCHISIPSNLLNQGKVSGHAKVENEPQRDFEFSDGDSWIDIPLQGKYETNDIVKIDLEIDRLWTPKQLGQGDDTREQGLAIDEVEYLL